MQDNSSHRLQIPSMRNANTVKCFAQNSRDEVRIVGGSGQVCGTLAAEPGMKQTNYIVDFLLPTQ